MSVPISAEIFSRMIMTGRVADDHVSRLIGYLDQSRIAPGFKEEVEAKRKELQALHLSLHTDQALFNQIILDQTRDHEHHELERDFRDFVESNDRGFWFLSGGPGIGKTAILANLAKTFEDRHAKRSIAYFFQYGAVDPNQNRLDGFYHYVYRQLRRVFSLLDQGDRSGHEALKAAFQEISINRQVSSNDPYFIFVDALDEMQREQYKKVLVENPLLFPPNLPEGLFVALTARESVAESDQIKSVSRHVAVRHLDFVDPKVWAKHQRSLRGYVRRLCENNREITAYHGTDQEPQSPVGKQSFIDELCEEAHYNFMIVQCALHSPLYWCGAGIGVKTSGDLKTFYEQHIRRMTQSKGSANDLIYRAALAFGLQPLISRNIFIRLAGKSGKPNKKLRESLKQWMTQGLIKQSRLNDLDWLFAYHRTFREFLNDHFKAAPRDEVLDPYAENLIDGVVLDGDLHEIEKTCQVGELRGEWAMLTLTVLRMTNRTYELSILANSLPFWQMAASAGVFREVLLWVTRIKVTPSNRRDYERVLKALVHNFKLWTSNNELEDVSGEKITARDISKIAQIEKTDAGQDDMLYLTDFWRADTLEKLK
ncbi:MAG: hypothetical protein AAF530_24120 [Pseudomonadota bacterium]